MEEWLCFVNGALGARDFVIMVQVPKSKHAKMMIDGLLFGGFNQLLGLDKDRGKVAAVEVNRVDTAKGIQNIRHRGHVYKRAHFLIQVKGLHVGGILNAKGQRIGGRVVNDFMIYVQIPKAADGRQDQEAVEAMVTGSGLAPFLGRFVKNIVPKRVSETGAQHWEEVGASLVMA